MVETAWGLGEREQTQSSGDTPVTQSVGMEKANLFPPIIGGAPRGDLLGDEPGFILCLGKTPI